MTINSPINWPIVFVLFVDTQNKRYEAKDDSFIWLKRKFIFIGCEWVCVLVRRNSDFFVCCWIVIIRLESEKMAVFALHVIW